MTKFEIRCGRWYGWQMTPGYGDCPYFSPILVQTVEPLGSGQSLLKLDFFNAGYAQGVQQFSKTLRIVLRLKTILFAEEDSQRGIVICEITRGWLESCCPWVTPPMSAERDVQAYLNDVFEPRNGGTAE